MPGRDDLGLLTDAALAAGDIARRYWDTNPQVWEKDDGAGPVTEADLAINDMLSSVLRAARPDYGWLSEETPDDDARLNRARCFILDPLDGTRAFIAGDKTFAHSLAVAEGGRIVAGVVYLPMHERLYTATAEGPALLNGAPIQASVRRDIAGAGLLASRPNMEGAFWHGGQAPAVNRSFRASLAYRLCLVAEGAFDAMLTLRPTWEWDIAAGALIATRAGATVTDQRGGALHFNGPKAQVDGVIAAPAALHQSFRDALRPA